LQQAITGDLRQSLVEALHQQQAESDRRQAQLARQIAQSGQGACASRYPASRTHKAPHATIARLMDAERGRKNPSTTAAMVSFAHGMRPIHGSSTGGIEPSRPITQKKMVGTHTQWIAMFTGLRWWLPYDSK
jgi:hypothetical protein